MVNERIEVRDSAAGITEDDIVKAVYGTMFRGFDLFKSFYLKHNGGEPDRCIFTTDSEERSSIQYFFSIKYRFHPKVETLEETNFVFRSRNVAEFFFDKLVFAEDAGGNPTCIHLPSGEVIFVPLDCGLDLDNQKRFLAETFGEFVDNLAFYEEEED